MKPKPGSAKPEFSHLVVVDKIPAAGMTETLRAKDDERQRLAERFGLAALSKLEAKLDVHNASGRTVAVTGRIVADVVQTCVVSLEPVPAHIDHGIDVLYAAAEQFETEAGQLGPDEQEMEPIIDGAIDLGELVAQHLGVALNPYPRKPGLAFVEAEYGNTMPQPGALASLVNLRQKPKDSE